MVVPSSNTVEIEDHLLIYDNHWLLTYQHVFANVSNEIDPLYSMESLVALARLVVITMTPFVPRVP